MAVSGAGIKVLVVDDSLGIRLLARKLFRNLGYDVEVVEDGFEALEKLAAAPFDLAVIDWSMPKMSGLELLGRLRESDRFAKLPVLLVTAEEEPDQLLGAIKAGADSYMTKPYDAAKLKEKIDRIFEFRDQRKNRPPVPDF
ncbi:MAG: hypothetical protein A2600_10360 [Candidatus Lambdaproteobacteria bacterium RIFOXYD1_FULL_56_27]|uniref:Response regulatory domain-containing protein n=1 Tax=Candidatus Lambdaproteobacteria bacterium RIFOXYD2_FULL_56_26 TaxID=1817773 RepID=A0A1F6GQV3_9PROT|nr:MAG: hypothetical protein A2557_09325 [Candidatus Lambdaproteobacteria bacterium RIFOXYD2_FULL_56_26]OGH04165.1 MAG: hypothetical protein A2426_02715 [Candidatus Lambdaproteobacteria bacterium RIFOXYC1_FULL_56_13]OGH06387.1 MAG: hypothetical protein A2600_10360 [Candidatus Lambdaproteobacteria bacterium RIFOXYD1_FULL_56_27]